MRSSAKSRRRYKFILIMVLLLFLVFLNPKNIFSPVRNAVLSIASPVQRAAFSFFGGIHNFLSFLKSIGELKQENENLLSENRTLQMQRARMELIEQENQELRKQLRLLPQEEFVLEHSLVIGFDLHESGSRIIIDKGTRNNIKDGMTVITNGSILVGKVEQTNYNNSLIRLINNPASLVNAVIAETGARGVVKGDFGLGIVMEMIRQSDLVTKDNEVLTSGLGGNFPPNILIGKVTEVRESDDKLFQIAIISTPLDLSRLAFVSVITNENQ